MSLYLSPCTLKEARAFVQRHHRKPQGGLFAVAAAVGSEVAAVAIVGEAGGGSWNTPSRPRVDLHPTQVKLRWERQVSDAA